jgi:hypothetical protein
MLLLSLEVATLTVTDKLSTGMDHGPSSTPTVAVIVSFVAASPVRVAERSEASKAPCCFKNPGYAGTCKVEPAEDETCASILTYLGNPMAEEKGWTETACEEEDGEPAP